MKKLTDRMEAAMQFALEKTGALSLISEENQKGLLKPLRMLWVTEAKQDRKKTFEQTCEEFGLRVVQSHERNKDLLQSTPRTIALLHQKHNN